MPEMSQSPLEGVANAARLWRYAALAARLEQIEAPPPNPYHQFDDAARQSRGLAGRVSRS